ncbi:DUF6913 domain-containing protein [Flavobacterium sp. ZT3P35]|uniref:DUF6913 domain-containing protein n=1 Tax=Flavobacterium sp. ZT3P35 TaxID=3401727 RepID=UPI003AB05C93
MFLNYFKDFIVKKTLKKSFQNLKNSESIQAIKKIGVLVDASVFSETESLVKQLEVNGILAENISVIIYSDAFNTLETKKRIAFGAKHLRWNGKISSVEVNDFVNKEFDLLISYYNIEKTILLKVTHSSRALFKVGFSSIDKRLNHFMIQTDGSDFKLFISELFKYLKILNKI